MFKPFYSYGKQAIQFEMFNCQFRSRALTILLSLSSLSCWPAHFCTMWRYNILSVLKYTKGSKMVNVWQWKSRSDTITIWLKFDCLHFFVSVYKFTKYRLLCFFTLLLNAFRKMYHNFEHIIFPAQVLPVADRYNEKGQNVGITLHVPTRVLNFLNILWAWAPL